MNNFTFVFVPNLPRQHGASVIAGMKANVFIVPSPSMIVEPGFLTHWKTRLLCSLLNDPYAHVFVLYFWEHCQQRKQWIFDVSHKTFASICNYTGDAELFYSAMIQTFADQTEMGILAHDWDIVNASLVANWTNGKYGVLGKDYGKLGGRPSITPTKPPKGSKNNPHQTPDREDKIEKIREDKREYAPKVFLLVGEYETLCQERGKLETDEAIEFLAGYLDDNPKKKYRDHNRVLKNWVYTAVLERKAKEAQARRVLDNKKPWDNSVPVRSATTAEELDEKTRRWMEQQNG